MCVGTWSENPIQNKIWFCILGFAVRNTSLKKTFCRNASTIIDKKLKWLQSSRD